MGGHFLGSVGDARNTSGLARCELRYIDDHPRHRGCCCAHRPSSSGLGDRHRFKIQVRDGRGQQGGLWALQTAGRRRPRYLVRKRDIETLRHCPEQHGTPFPAKHRSLVGAFCGTWPAPCAACGVAIGASGELRFPSIDNRGRHMRGCRQRQYQRCLWPRQGALSSLFSEGPSPRTHTFSLSIREPCPAWVWVRGTDGDNKPPI